MTPRRPHRLPGQIAAMMAGTVLVFAVTLAVSVLWLTRMLDSQARVGSVAMAERALAGIESQVAAVTLDYAIWDEAARRVEAGDRRWLYDNMGSSAATGAAANLVVLWGGALPADLGWLDESPAAGLSGLAGTGTIVMAEARLASVPLGASEAVSFFTWRGNDLFVVAAARVERAIEVQPSLADEAIGRVLLGQRLERGQLAEISELAQVRDLRITRAAPPEGRLATPFLGGDGRPVAWLSWQPPGPGSAALARMLPILLPVTLLATGLALAGTVLAGRSARGLVRAQAAANAAALTDALTGLPNRAAFNLALARPAAAGERAVLFLDVNGFKRINDSIGHAAGDQVITRLARRLDRLSTPDCLLARIGGDEFVFVVEGPNAGFRAEWLAHAAERLVTHPVEVEGHPMNLQAAMGLAVQTTAAMSGNDLVRQADLAMYEAKRRRSRGPVAFGEVLDQASHDARAIEVALRAALERPGELWIAYQPLVAAEGQALDRAEALARWTSPELGPVPPDRFIAVAERAGLIVELGRQLLRLVCDDLVRHPELRVSVNISPIQLLAPDFVPDLIDLLDSRGIAPGRVQVELTECVVVDDPVLAARRLRELHEAGLSTALDDFGTGYSSIGTLRQMDFDTLKIDRSFVSGLAEAPERLALVQAMILLAHSLGLRVVCEGVETEGELASLRGIGCDLVQGYGIDRPLPIDALAARWLGRSGPGVDAAVA